MLKMRTLALLLHAGCCRGTVVFREKVEGYGTFRIPALLPEGGASPHVVALAEGRARVGGPGAACGGPHGVWQNNSCCYGKLASHYDGMCRDKDVVLKLSSDNGRTWGAVRPVATANETYFYSNLMVVFDKQQLVLMYSRCEVQTTPPGGESYATCVPVLRTSRDHGRTLSPPADLQVARGIGGPTIGLSLPVDDTGSSALSDGSTTAPTDGSSRRILFPFQCAPKFSSCALYSDDRSLGPASWRVSHPDFASTPSYGMECSIAAIPGSRVSGAGGGGNGSSVVGTNGMGGGGVGGGVSGSSSSRRSSSSSSSSSRSSSSRRVGRDTVTLVMLSRNANRTAIRSVSSDLGSTWSSDGYDRRFYTSGCETSSVVAEGRFLFAHPNRPDMPASAGPSQRQNMTITAVAAARGASGPVMAELQIYSGPSGYSSVNMLGATGGCAVLYERSSPGAVPIDFESIELARFRCDAQR